MLTKLSKYLNLERIDYFINLLIVCIGLYVIGNSIIRIIQNDRYSIQDGTALLLGALVLVFAGILSKLDDLVSAFEEYLNGKRED
jgi:hypothetical protein